MIDSLKSWFNYPGLDWGLLLISIGLAVAFGLLWLLTHWPPMFRKHWLWVVAVFSAFFTLLALVFVQIPLQHWTQQAFSHFYTNQTLNDWILLIGVPLMLISGLVQEGAKMVPIVFWWWRSNRTISPKLGLAIGALSGAGFGVFEAFWVIGRLFRAGWTTQAIQTDGFIGIAGFWERFFVIGFHVAASALAGYGLAKGKGWQFYLIVAVLHGFLNYMVVLWAYIYRNDLKYPIVEMETSVAVIAIVITTVVLLLRWRKRGEDEDEEEVEVVDINT